MGEKGKLMNLYFQLNATLKKESNREGSHKLYSKSFFSFPKEEVEKKQYRD